MNRDIPRIEEVTCDFREVRIWLEQDGHNVYMRGKAAYACPIARYLEIREQCSCLVGLGSITIWTKDGPKHFRHNDFTIKLLKYIDRLYDGSIVTSEQVIEAINLYESGLI